MSENLKGIPISSLPKADELAADDQLIAYRSDDGKAYRANVGSLGEAAESNISDAFSTFRTYSAGDYCIYNDTLWKFTADKDAGDWDESVVEKTNVGTEVSELNTNLSDIPRFEFGSFVSDSDGQFSVTFKEPFSSSPYIFCNFMNGGSATIESTIECKIATSNANGFTGCVMIRNQSGSASFASYTIAWMAVL